MLYSSRRTISSFSFVELRVEVREVLQRRDDGLHHERHVGQPRAALLGDGLELFAQFDEFRHVHLVVVGDVRRGVLRPLHLVADGLADALVGDALAGTGAGLGRCGFTRRV
ncbi:hypothetical protein D320_19204, partial [Haloferax sp. BAB-2207]